MTRRSIIAWLLRPDGDPPLPLAEPSRYSTVYWPNNRTSVSFEERSLPIVGVCPVCGEPAFEMPSHGNASPSYLCPTCLMEQQPKAHAATGRTYRLAVNDCPRCGADLIDITTHGDFDAVYECQNGHWFYGWQHTDGLEMFNNAPRHEIVREMNEAYRSSRERDKEWNMGRRPPSLPVMPPKRKREGQVFVNTRPTTPRPPVMPPPQRPQPATGATHRLARHCPDCGDTLPNDAIHCIQCGTRVR